MFDTFCLAAFARNGRIPDDLEQRSIVIELQRRLPGERLEVLRDDRSDHLQNLARMCARWVDDVAGIINDHDPDMGELINRVADNWRPLFTLGDTIGDDWSDRIRDAAHALIGTEPDSDDSVLLADIKLTFDVKNTDRLWSGGVCEALAAMEGRPWAEYGKSGKPISKNQLAKRLKRFGIVPDTIRIGGDTAKGYYRNQFEEAWKRYLAPQSAAHLLPSQEASETSQRHNPTAASTSEPFPNVTEKSLLRFETSEKPPSDGHCYVVTDREGENARRACAQCGGTDDGTLHQHGEVWLHPECVRFWNAGDIPGFLDRRPGRARR
jgi:hypothetical protein